MRRAFGLLAVAASREVKDLGCGECISAGYNFCQGWFTNQDEVSQICCQDEQCGGVDISPDDFVCSNRFDSKRAALSSCPVTEE